MLTNKEDLYQNNNNQDDKQGTVTGYIYFIVRMGEGLLCLHLLVFLSLYKKAKVLESNHNFLIFVSFKMIKANLTALLMLVCSHAAFAGEFSLHFQKKIE